MGNNVQVSNTLKAAIARNIISLTEPLKMQFWALTTIPTSKHTSFFFSKEAFIIHLLNTPAKSLEYVPATDDN